MTLFLIGLGLSDEADVTIKGLHVIKGCKKVYLEHYTSILTVGLDKLKALYGRDDLQVADRDFVEMKADIMISEAQQADIALLVVGDPFGATTHADLRLRAHASGVPVEVIHNASIMNAVATCGLQLYRFGQTISMCFWTDKWQPDSYYEKILENLRMGLHTLCLLDIKMKEASEENILRGRSHLYEPPRFMTVNEAIRQLLSISTMKSCQHIGPHTFMVGLARVGAKDQQIVFAEATKLAEFDFGGPLHCLVIPAALHEVERRVLQEIYPPPAIHS